jgi:hypothetical protein
LFLSQLDNPRSYAGPVWLNSIRQVQERKDKILGIEALTKHDTNRYEHVWDALPEEDLEQVRDLVARIDDIVEPYGAGFQ